MSRVSKRAVSLAGGVVAGAGLLLIAGAFVGASPALADNPNSPHVATEGTGAANATTCAGCHRAHSAKSSDGFLLTQTDETTLCFSCHGTSGTGASTDVQDGVAYAVSGSPVTRNNPAVKTGALRGGGFASSFLDTTNATRQFLGGDPAADVDRTLNNIPADIALATNTTSTSQHTLGTSQTLWGSGAISATPAGGKAAVYLKCTSCHNPHGNGNYRILKEIPQTYNSTLSSATNALATTGTAMTATGRNVTITGATAVLGTAGQSPAGSVVLTFAVDPANTVQLNAGQMISVTGTTGFDFTRASINSVSQSPANGSGNMVATGFTVEGIWATPAITAVPTAWTGTATVTPLFPDVSNGTYTYTTTNYWNADDPNTPQGKWWSVRNGTLTQNTSQYSVVSNVSAWCSTCHTRYNANNARSTNSGDDIYKFRHTSNSSKLNSPNCIQCHVAHGSNAVMSGNSALQTPTDSTGAVVSGAAPADDSKLLRANGRGICEMCHNE